MINKPLPGPTGDKGRDSLRFASTAVEERNRVIGWQEFWISYQNAINGQGSDQSTYPVAYPTARPL